ncbi:MFS general substrate transporter [Suhomyces tanzawaensis NRRL Y-17324]|uniref:MFS general substrate transporter n=1 Tax=Suhomyces tanzawaensis NRRL Y-17324 TaxID=984487 RepID=A0A1E4SE83_9ASCO|nr:MFS general substrate transporter [Suhomyces tanzawaensis NRRL Y-17324]ODV77815.1 MFS general substrate transporter [Suhomyces tanzawaensis NRRL Y-17324]
MTNGVWLSPVVHKVFVLLSCTFLGLICGTLYLYSSYSPQFAHRLKYSVTDASSIALMGTLGVAVTGPVAGAVVDKTGYTIALVIGGLQIIIGYLSMKGQFDNEYGSVKLSAFLVFAIGSGSTFINSACLKCCAVNFPSIRGVATSLPLALYGLSAMFYSVLASIFYPGDTSGFLGFLAYSAIVIFVICAPCVISCDWSQESKSLVTKPHPADSIEMSSLKPERTPQLSPHVTIARSPGYQQIERESMEISGMKLVKSSKFWLIFVVTGTLASLGQMYIYSVGYMVKAIVSFEANNLEPGSIFTPEVEGLIQRDQQLQVGLLSVANCAGRILSGVMGDVISQSFKKSRTRLLFLPCFGLMFTQILGFEITRPNDLSLDSLLTGLFYGYTFCIMPMIVGDLFGMENFSSNWGIVGLAPILPSFYFTSLFGKIYDANSSPLSGVDEAKSELVCLIGKHCYNSIFKLTLFITFISLVCVVFLNSDIRLRTTR